MAEDDDYDQGGRNQRHQREAPPGTRIRKGLLEIAEDHGRLAHEVAANLAKLTADHYDDEYVQELFSTVTLRTDGDEPEDN